jgi:anti-sigma factor RsiW
MADPANHPSELLQDAIDGRLDPSQRAALEAHLATCDRCRREMTALRWTKTQLAATVPGVDPSVDFAGQLRRTLDEEDRQSSGTTGQLPTRSARRSSVAYWLAAAAAVIALVWIANRSEVPSAPAQAAADFRAFSSGSTPLEVRTADPATLEARLRAAGLPFAARVFDFGMMKYSLTGGGLHRFLGRPSALFAYRSADGRGVVCQMYQGQVTELPPAIERRRQNDIDFLVYREGKLTVVFWQEGDVLCVLVADGDAEAAIRLAYGKAVKV